MAGTDLTAALNRHQPGEGITLKVIRGGDETDVQVILGLWPEG